MNDHHMMNLANSTIAERRAEADRYRLARSGRTAPTEARSGRRGRKAGEDARAALSSLLRRMAPSGS